MSAVLWGARRGDVQIGSRVDRMDQAAAQALARAAREANSMRRLMILNDAVIAIERLLLVRSSRW